MLLSTVLALAASSTLGVIYGSQSGATTPEKPIVLVLVEELTWEYVEDEPASRRAFEVGSSANVSTAQGPQHEDERVGYISLGAGARVDALALPDELPKNREELLDAFTGPAATVVPGSLGEALEDSGLEPAAVGSRAALVVMDYRGRIPLFYDGDDPASQTERALDEGADLVAVEVEDAKMASELSEAAENAGAAVAVASPNAPEDAATLTPFAISGEDGLLYSPNTRATGLITNADVAPTLLSRLGADGEYSFQGRPAETRSGTFEEARRLGERISFVSESRYLVWTLVVAALAVVSVIGHFRWGGRFLRPALLTVAALPAGALLAAVVPTTRVPVVAALVFAFSAAISALALKTTRSPSGAFAAALLAVAFVICVDAAFGGELMKVSILGYNPVYGARFYGIGNEMSAVLAGCLTMGLGALRERWKPPVYLVAVVGLFVVSILGLPMMGADVGGSLALGFGLGLTVGLLHARSLIGTAAWTAGGSGVAMFLLLASGLLFPDASHGTRALSDGESLWETMLRKLLISLEILSVFPLLVLFAAFSGIIFLGWRKTKGTPIGAGIIGAVATALASGAINDSGLVATLFVLLYPVLASAMHFLPNERSRVK